LSVTFFCKFRSRFIESAPEAPLTATFDATSFGYGVLVGAVLILIFLGLKIGFEKLNRDRICESSFWPENFSDKVSSSNFGQISIHNAIY
jgi:hypothetical protein